MCGICGAIQVGGSPRRVLAPGVLERMTEVLAHRGPDDHGLYERDGAAIGARRLSIVDVEGGHQPFANERGDVWAVQNGELYNHARLRDALRTRGHSFRSRCDTEILPHLYEEHGPGFPTQLRGMFGAAVYDERRRRAVIARDRLGIKPLYYARVGDVVVFASELKSLLASGLVDPVLDFEAIDAYLSLGYFAAPATPLQGVFKVLPGSVLVVDPDGVRTEVYWSYPEPAVAESRRSVDEYGEQLMAALEESVRLRLMSDVPLGAMLSGGLDSSLIVALMARHMDEPVKTFSVGFAGDADSNELGAARRVAEALGTEHHELELRPDADIVGLEELVWHLDEPVASLSALGFYALSELAARHVTVALSGQGADEQLGGYRKHLAASLAGHVGSLPAPVGRLAGAVAGRFGNDRIRRVLGAEDASQRLLASSARLTPAERAALVRGPLQALDGRAAERVVAARAGRAKAALPAALFLDGQLALVDDMLHYFDRTSMAHSLEVRVPFLDHEFVELCASIPPELKVRRLTTKYLLRRIAHGVVPEEAITRPKVSFFHRNLEQWFRGRLGDSARSYLLDPAPRYAELLDQTAVSELARDYLDGRRASSGHLLLAVLMLEVWLSTFLPRAQRLASEAPRMRLTA
jgi:asparagine synthase (glutamine-hydrolysing)